MEINLADIRKRLNSFINKQVSIAPLASFRILFGILLLFSTLRFISKGWVDDLYVKPFFYFTYTGFEWVHPFSRTGMYVVFFSMAAASLFITLGFLYRLSALAFFLLFTYVELIDKTNYLNHYYFVSIISLFLVLLPANRYASLDIKFGITKPVIQVPAWCINVIKLQIGMVYVFAGIAKINYDWLINAQPLKIWLNGRDYLPVIGGLFHYSFVPYLFSWFGMLFDLTIVFFLLNKKSRPYAYFLVIVFHLMTSYLFQIGVFPYVMIAATWIFFSEDFHKKFLSLFRPNINIAPANYQPSASKYLLTFFFLHFIVQLFMPFRYLLYPGKLFWTEQGYRFSWRVMLMEKNGYSAFTVKDKKGRIYDVKKSYYLTPQQEKMMNTQPDMILQFAHYIAGEYKNMSIAEPQVYVDSYVSVNGRRSQQFIDPNVDLVKQTNNFLPKKWILPLIDK